MAFGAADFLGGLATRRSSALPVVITSQVYGLGLIVLLLPTLPPERYAPADFLWGTAAGVSGAMGLVALYRGLSIGRMGVIAPVTAAVGAIVPAMFGLLTGERPSSMALAGAAVALVAIVLVSRQPASGLPDARAMGFLASTGVREALAAGAAFGGFFILIAQSTDTSGLWPLIGARIGSLLFLVAVALGLRRKVALRAETTPLVIGAGVLDIAANALFLYAIRGGFLTLVAVLSSLYPAATIVLARAFLKEKLSSGQLFGVVLALTGIALIAAG